MMTGLFGFLYGEEPMSWRKHYMIFKKDFQNDFAVRMDWCVKDYAAANYPPVVKLSHSSKIDVVSGEYCVLNAAKSYDPDGNHLSFVWFPYMEAVHVNLLLNHLSLKMFIKLLL